LFEKHISLSLQTRLSVQAKIISSGFSGQRFRSWLNSLAVRQTGELSAKDQQLGELNPNRESSHAFGGFTDQFMRIQKLKIESSDTPKPGKPSDMDNLMPRMQEMQVRADQQNRSSASAAKDDPKAGLDKLIANLQSKRDYKKPEIENNGGYDSDIQKEEDRSSASDPFTPATETFGTESSADTKAPDASNHSIIEMLRVKQELAAAKSVITRQEQELAESRNLKHTIDQAMGPASEADFGNRADMHEETINHLQGAFNATARPYAARADSWNPHEDSRSDNSDGLAAGGYNRGTRGIWNGPSQPIYGTSGSMNQPVPQQPSFIDNRNATGAWPPPTSMQVTQSAIPTNPRVFSGPSVPSYGFQGRYTDDGSQFNPGDMRRTTSQYNRPNPGYNNRAGPFGGSGGFGAGLPALTTTPMNPLGFSGPLGYQPRPIGSPLSPTASEFTANSLPPVGNAWTQVSPTITDTATS
jgi:hypothetical protein